MVAHVFSLVNEMSVKVGTICDVLMERRLEVWRPVENCTPDQLKDAKTFKIFGGIEKALIDIDVKTFDLNDLVVDDGLQATCECARCEDINSHSSTFYLISSPVLSCF